MFEEICRKTGTIRIPTGEYSDSAPVFNEVEVSYFTMTETFRNADGILQSTFPLPQVLRSSLVMLCLPRFPVFIVFPVFPSSRAAVLISAASAPEY